MAENIARIYYMDCNDCKYWKNQKYSKADVKVKIFKFFEQKNPQPPGFENFGLTCLHFAFIFFSDLNQMATVYIIDFIVNYIKNFSINYKFICN